MNKLKRFEEFLDKKIIRKVKPDTIRAKDMVQKTESSYMFLKEIIEKIKINDNNANDIISHSYNIVMELLRAKLSIDGYKASGIASHEAEVSYMIVLGFSENEVEFLDELRRSRNRIMYYENSYDESYARNVIRFLDSVYPRLKNIIGK